MFSRYTTTGMNNEMDTILFDLDGTLLPMNQEDFLDTYFKALRSRLEGAGYDADLILNAINEGTRAMIQNDGKVTNEEVFMKVFKEKTGDSFSKRLIRVINKFYQKDFDVAKLNTKPTPYASKCVSMLKRKGYKLAVATNPVFPEIAISKRIEWAGLCQNDFDWITTYENSFYTKPNLH